MLRIIDEYRSSACRQRAVERNLGRRIDYQLVTPSVAPFVRTPSIYRDERFSDRAPLTIRMSSRSSGGALGRGETTVHA